MRENKRLEYRQQIVGNLVEYLGFGRVAYEDMASAISELASDVSETLDHR